MYTESGAGTLGTSMQAVPLCTYFLFIYLLFGDSMSPCPHDGTECILSGLAGDIDQSWGCPTFLGPIRRSPGRCLRGRDEVLALVVVAWRLETGIPARDVLQGSADFTVILRTNINLIAEVGGRHPMPMVQWGVPVQGIQ